jgi:hypothetical protein
VTFERMKAERLRRPDIQPFPPNRRLVTAAMRADGDRSLRLGGTAIASTGRRYLPVPSQASQLASCSMSAVWQRKPT